MEEDRRACLESGMDEYLSKPVKVETLRQVLQACEDASRGVIDVTRTARRSWREIGRDRRPKARI
jgi:CheY-like chemotaxis protein